MKPKSVMLIAGEASGDLLAAELVQALREEFATLEAQPTWDYQPLEASLDPRFFGAGGPRMAATGVELAFDLTTHSVVGFIEVIKNYATFRRLFKQLYDLALAREPELIVCVDYFGFNSRFAHAIRKFVRPRQDWFHDWNPKIVQYVSPQVWASRESRIYQLAQDFDLLLALFPFEKEWYAKRVPGLRVEFVGHPILDRYNNNSRTPGTGSQPGSASPRLLLLPGSRRGELARHLKIVLGAVAILRKELSNVRIVMVLPTEDLSQQARRFSLPSDVRVQVGGLGEALSQADLAIAKSGTVTLECALMGVPTVAFYKTSWPTYQLVRRIIKVKHVAMPNLIADEEVFPEFIQNAATPEAIAQAALDLLRDQNRRTVIQRKLATVTSQLGSAGASKRAARALVNLLERVEPTAVGVGK